MHQSYNIEKRDKVKKFTISFSLILILISSYLYVVAGGFGSLKGQKDIGPAAFPQGVSVALIILCVLLIIMEIKKEKDEKVILMNLKLFLGVLSIIIFALVFKKVGFIISSIFITFINIRLLLNESFKKRWIMVFVTSVFVPVVIYVIFSHFLKVPLPKGVLEAYM